MDFKVGDKVKLLNGMAGNYSIKEGATGIMTGIEDDSICVLWDLPEIRCGHDGCGIFEEKRFKTMNCWYVSSDDIALKEIQMEFDF